MTIQIILIALWWLITMAMAAFLIFNFICLCDDVSAIRELLEKKDGDK